MRSNRLVLLLMAAAVSALALAPAGASARHGGRARVHVRATGPCHVRVQEPGAPIATGEKATIVGKLVCPGREAAGGKLVTLYGQSAPNPGFVSLGTATTESGGSSNGAFAITTPPLETNTLVYATAEGAKSARRTIRVQAQVTPGPPTPAEGAQLFTKSGHGPGAARVKFAGTVSPLDKGARVVLQRENATANEEWRAIQFGTVAPDGTYLIEHDFVMPGDANIRVVVRPSGINAPAASTPASYEISQRENPALKLESPANPIGFGQSVTLNGVVAGAPAGTPVTLLAHGKLAPFAPVATTTTGPGGVYEFTQMPQASTYYRVKSPSVNSAVLFEGVKYILTTAAPPSTGQVGQPLTFSGTVLPALSGHVVYLERQSSLRLGWHVIDVGTVGTPAKPGEAAPFSIVHAFGSPGPARLRLKIPGDPANQGVSGTPFEVNVTSAEASTLGPLTPPRQPSEGQV